MIWEICGGALVLANVVAARGGEPRLSQRWSTRALVVGFFLALCLHFAEEVREG